MLLRPIKYIHCNIFIALIFHYLKRYILFYVVSTKIIYSFLSVLFTVKTQNSVYKDLDASRICSHEIFVKNLAISVFDQYKFSQRITIAQIGRSF